MLWNRTVPETPAGRWITAVVGIAAAVLLILPEAARAEVPTGLTRLAGSSRVETALDVSRAVFPDGPGGYVLATADGFPDALAGSVLAAQVGGPVLLTPGGELPADVLLELGRVGGGQSFVVGGGAAVSDAVVDDTSAVRIAGGDRYATAALTALQVVALAGTPEVVYVTTGEGFADAVSVAGLAAAQGSPILLADAGHTDAAAAFVAGHEVGRVVAVGGGAVVPDEVLAAVAGDAPTARLAGADRYATSHVVAEAATAAGADPASVWIATGADYPDALSAGAAVAASGGVLHLAARDTTDTDAGAGDVRALLADGCPLERVVLVGGEGALGAEVADQAEAAGITCEDSGTGGLDEPACDDSYPTLCVPPPPPDLNCDDIAETDFPVEGDDPHGFDADSDGVGCES